MKRFLSRILGLSMALSIVAQTAPAQTMERPGVTAPTWPAAPSYFSEQAFAARSIDYIQSLAGHLHAALNQMLAPVFMSVTPDGVAFPLPRGRSGSRSRTSRRKAAGPQKPLTGFPRGSKVEWHGRHAVVKMRGQPDLLVTFAKEDQSALDLEAAAERMHQAATEFGLHVPDPFRGANGRHVQRFVGLLPERPDEPALNSDLYCVTSALPRRYFTYLTDDLRPRFRLRWLRARAINRMALLAVNQIADLREKGWIHTSLAPTSHHVSSERRWLWDYAAGAGGLLNEALEDYQFVNIGNAGLRDAEHLEPRNSANESHHLGQNLAELFIAIGVAGAVNGLTANEISGIQERAARRFRHRLGLPFPPQVPALLQRFTTLFRTYMSREARHRSFSSQDRFREVLPLIQAVEALVQDLSPMRNLLLEHPEALTVKRGSLFRAGRNDAYVRWALYPERFGTSLIRSMEGVGMERFSLKDSGEIRSYDSGSPESPQADPGFFQGGVLFSRDGRYRLTADFDRRYRPNAGLRRLALHIFANRGNGAWARRQTLVIPENLSAPPLPPTAITWGPRAGEVLILSGSGFNPILRLRWDSDGHLSQPRHWGGPLNTCGLIVAGGLVASPDGRFVYVTDGLERRIVQLAVTSGGGWVKAGELAWAESRDFAEHGLRGIAISPNGKTLYAAYPMGHSVVRVSIDGRNRMRWDGAFGSPRQENIRIGGIQAVVLHPLGRFLYATGPTDVLQIDLSLFDNSARRRLDSLDARQAPQKPQRPASRRTRIGRPRTFRSA